MIRDEKQQIASFHALHTILKPVGGLDSVIVFDDSLGSTLDSAITIVKGVKSFDEKIASIIVTANTDELDHKLSATHAFDVVVEGNASFSASEDFSRKIDLTKTDQSIYDIEDNIFDTLPLMKRWETAVRNIAGTNDWNSLRRRAQFRNFVRSPLSLIRS